MQYYDTLGSVSHAPGPDTPRPQVRRRLSPQEVSQTDTLNLIKRLSGGKATLTLTVGTEYGSGIRLDRELRCDGGLYDPDSDCSGGSTYSERRIVIKLGSSKIFTLDDQSRTRISLRGTSRCSSSSPATRTRSSTSSACVIRRSTWMDSLGR